MKLVESVTITPQERLENEQVDVRNGIKEVTNCKERIHALSIKIKTEFIHKDKKKRFKSQRKQERKTLKTLHKNLDQQTSELATAQYIVNNPKED